MRPRVKSVPTLLLAVVLGLLALLWASPSEAVAQEVDYNRADRLLSWNVEPLAQNVIETIEWLEDPDRFWYRVRRGQEREFVMVHPERGERRLLFDNARLAATLSQASDTTYDARTLPFERFDLIDGDRVIQFDHDDQRFRCDIVDYECQMDEAPDERRHMVASPDSAWEVFARDHDLYLRPFGGGDTIRLTEDGEEYWAYGLRAPSSSSQIRSDRPRRPNVKWSPDSRRIAVPRVDERGMEHMPLYSSTPQRPELYTYPYALPGDSVIPRPHYYAIDIPDGDKRKAELDEVLVRGGFAEGTDRTWTGDGAAFRLLLFSRGYDDGRLLEVDAATAEVRELAREQSPTFVDLAVGPKRDDPNWYVANDGQTVIWYSQRDGWPHLYRLDGEGAIRNQITQGNWAVARIHHVDESAGRIFFSAWGREPGPHPYHEHLYRVDFDGTDLRLLTPDEAMHEIDFSPDGRYFVDTRSQVDEPPVSVVRRASDGEMVLPLEEADIQELLEVGWRPPEVFRAKARDGTTDLYGLMYRPSDFDPERSYPVVNWIYPGPQMGSVRDWGFTLEYWAARFQALAELGFVVLTIDHMGTPMRSKALHDSYYGDLGDNGLPDHVAVIRQLGARHRWMDLSRVGIYGNSGGGFASTRAILEYPHVFHVAVSAAGNHDNRTYSFTWGEKYHGPYEKDPDTGEDPYEMQANAPLAENLEGKLFLIHGDLDNNVHPAMTLQVVNALVEANKTFDLLILPDGGHSMRGPYVIRRTWDYFVEHLLGKQPPADYLIIGEPDR